MRSSSSYGAGTANRSRATKAELAQLHDQIFTVLAEDHPQSVRHVYYRMTDPRLLFPVPKTENGYRQVGRELVKLRQRGIIPYKWISDSTRMGYFVDTFTDASDFISNFAGLYRADLWRDFPAYPEVWCESRSIAGVIRSLCQEYGVSLYPAGGFSSETFIWEAAQQINRDSNGRQLRVLYIGDYDPAGVLIDKDIERKMRQHLDPCVHMTFMRIGITEEQITRFDLPTKPRKESDRRVLDLKKTVEAEAMPTGILKQLLRDQFEALIPDGQLDVVRAAEESEQAFLLNLANLVGNDDGRLIVSDFCDDAFSDGDGA